MAEAILNVIAIIALVLIGGFIVYLLAELILSVDGKRGTLLFRNRKNTDRDNEILLEYNKNHETNDSFYLPNEKSKDLMLDFDKQYEHTNETDLQTNNINMLRAEEEQKLLEAKQKAEGEIKPEEPKTQVYDDFVYVNEENPNKYEDEPEETEDAEEDDDDQSIEEILASIQERNKNTRNRFVANLNEEDETPFEEEDEKEDEKDERLDAQQKEIDRLNSMILELKEQIESKVVTPTEIEEVVENEEVEEQPEEVVEEPQEEIEEVEEQVEETVEEKVEPVIVEKIVEVQDTAEIERLNSIINELNAKVEEEQAKNAELAKQAENVNNEEEITEETLKGYEEKLAELLERQKLNDKDLRINKKEYIPLARIEKTLESDKNKLRRKEAIVAKKKIVLFGVNNYVADPEKEKKLAEDLDLLEGLKLSVQHCEEVMDNNKDRYPVLKHANEILTRNAVEIQEDIDEINAKIAHAKEVLGIKDGE